MTFYLFQNEQTLGPYTREDMETYIHDGLVAPADFVFSEGSPDWKPASEIFPERYETGGIRITTSVLKDESGVIVFQVAPKEAASDHHGLEGKPTNGHSDMAVDDEKSGAVSITTTLLKDESGLIEFQIAPRANPADAPASPDNLTNGHSEPDNETKNLESEVLHITTSGLKDESGVIEFHVDSEQSKPTVEETVERFMKDSGLIEFQVAPNAIVAPTSLETLKTLKIMVPPKAANAKPTAAAQKSAELRRAAQQRKSVQSLSTNNLLKKKSGMITPFAAPEEEKKGFFSKLLKR